MITYTVGIDWDSDGTYTDEVEYTLKMTVRRGRESAWTSSGRVPVRYGEATITLNNYSRRYDPTYAAGDLYDYLLPGKQVRIAATENAVTYWVFAGWILDIRPGDNRDYKAEIIAVDGLYWLGQQRTEADGPDSNYLVTSALFDLAEMSDYPTLDLYTFPFTFPLSLSAFGLDENGDQIATYQVDDQSTILQAMEDIAEAFGGTVYIDAGGSLRYSVRYPTQPTTYEVTDADVIELSPRTPWSIIYNALSATPTVGAAQTGSNSTSQTTYGRRDIEITSNDFIQNTTQAANLVYYLGSFLPFKRDELYFRARGNGAMQFGRDLMQTIRYIGTHNDIDTVFYVAGIAHEILPASNTVTTYYLEQSIYESTDIDVFPFTFDLENIGW